MLLKRKDRYRIGGTSPSRSVSPIRHPSRAFRIYTHWSLLLFGLVLSLGLGCNRFLSRALRIESLSPQQLSANLTNSNPPLVLDVRDLDDYLESHIPGAKSIPLQGIEGYLSRKPVSMERGVVVVCRSGVRSKLGAATAASWHRGKVYDLSGGMSAWTALGLPQEHDGNEVIPIEGSPLPVKRLSLYFQTQAYLLAAVVKPFYMVMCLALIVVLARTKATPLRLLFWGLVCFEVGESFCAFDIAYCSAGSALSVLDLLHGAGMVGAAVLVPWALLRLADERVIRYADAQHSCTIQRFCGSCWKQHPVTCGLHQLFLYTLPALAILSLIPLTKALSPIHYIGPIFSNPYPYGAPIFNEVIELQAYALLGCCCFIAAWFVLRGSDPSKVRRAELPFFLGIGFSSFSLFRFFLHEVFRPSVHGSDFWEEIMETLAVLSLALVLYIFRAQLGLGKKAFTPAGAQPTP